MSISTDPGTFAPEVQEFLAAVRGAAAWGPA